MVTILPRLQRSPALVTKFLGLADSAQAKIFSALRASVTRAKTLGYCLKPLRGKAAGPPGRSFGGPGTTSGERGSDPWLCIEGHFTDP